MPVHQNAEILEPPTKSTRWPVMMFSHGLGGTRNAYSHVCGSLASHGIVVVAPDHRDGSSPLSIYHNAAEKGKDTRVEYRSIAHKPSTDVYEARDDQLRIRLSELGLIHDTLLKLDKGQKLKNVAPDQPKKTEEDILSMFTNLLNIHEPGSISFAGHSFGACTMIQFVKSIYYRSDTEVSGYKPLYTPSPNSSLIRQITPANPIILLDLWTLPIQSPATSWLRSKPMPSYDSTNGGKNLLAILSEGFYKWTSNFNEVKRIVAPPTNAAAGQSGPHVFYPISSAHLSQSDFGVLFPWATTKIFGAKEPERVLRLNTRAILQVLRESGVEVANTSAADLEIGDAEPSIQHDKAILSRAKDSVRDWVNLSAQGTGSDSAIAERVERKSLGGRVGSGDDAAGPGEAMVEGEALGQVVSRDER